MQYCELVFTVPNPLQQHMQHRLCLSSFWFLSGGSSSSSSASRGSGSCFIAGCLVCSQAALQLLSTHAHQSTAPHPASRSCKHRKAVCKALSAGACSACSTALHIVPRRGNTMSRMTLLFAQVTESTVTDQSVLVTLIHLACSLAIPNCHLSKAAMLL